MVNLKLENQSLFCSVLLAEDNPKNHVGACLCATRALFWLRVLYESPHWLPSAMFCQSRAFTKHRKFCLFCFVLTVILMLHLNASYIFSLFKLCVLNHLKSCADTKNRVHSHDLSVQKGHTILQQFT